MTTPSLTTETVAYAAGLFDGEGYVTINVSERTAVLYVGIVSTCFEPIRWMKVQFGGYLTGARIQRATGHLGKRPIMGWKTTNGNAVEFLKAVYPYLQIKKRQAALAFKFRKVMEQNFRKSDTHRQQLLRELAQEIRDLNRGKLAGVETVKPALETVNSQSTVLA